MTALGSSAPTRDPKEAIREHRPLHVPRVGTFHPITGRSGESIQGITQRTVN
jgi:hypothetical protein